ncbi:tetratricopeptide repeat protein [Roseibacillus ishigakijimensis]|nr:tetratricopeptide repeat protein [Roseibacillus ishigakijimensis]
MRLLFLFLLTLPLTVAAQKRGEKVTSSFPLTQVLVGEEALLNVQIEGERPNGSLSSTQASELSFRTLEPDYINEQFLSLNIGVSAAEPGVKEVPAFRIPLASGEQVSETFAMEVFPADKIQWNTLAINNQNYRIGSLILYPTGSLYAGQAVPLTAKLLLPENLPVRSIGYAEIEKDNIGAWRMEAPFPPRYDQRVRPRSPNALQPRTVKVDGQSYQVVNYVTIAAPLSDGTVTVGPGTVQGLQVQISTTTQRGGFYSSMSRSYNLELELPAISFEALPLPAGAPEGFAGAVGAFTLETTLDQEGELKPGDPVMVNLAVSGEGNLDTLAAPELEAPEKNWKTYPPSRKTDDTRRSNRGTVNFSQILRPLVPIEEVPSFTLSFFNPATTSYETLRSEPIPLTLSPLASGAGSSAPPPAGLVPVPEMTDILGLIDPQPYRARSGPSLLPWWQVLPALVVVILLLLIVRRHLPRLRQEDPEKARLQAELEELRGKSDAREFLRAAANLAEREGEKGDDFVAELIAERDARCFQPGEKEPELPASRREDILAQLKKRLSQVILLPALLLLGTPHQAEAFHEEALRAWNEGDYEAALAAYELARKDQETPDLLFNIGNCHYRLGKPGKAGLFYHRALELDPKHPEARQNLAFLERKMGAISTLPDAAPGWPSRSLLRTLLAASAWAFAIFLLLRFARPDAKSKRLSTLGQLGTGLALLTLALVLFFHPRKESTAPPVNAVVVSSEASPVRSEPSAGGSIILKAGPSTACRVLAERGPWSYIELPDHTRGWIISDGLESI